MKKIDCLYNEYQMYNDVERLIFFRTIKSVDIKTYYKLQGKIFVEMQTNLYKEIAQMLVDDCMRYFKKFSIDIVDILVDEMQFLDIPADTKKANQSRINNLKLT